MDGWTPEKPWCVRINGNVVAWATTLQEAKEIHRTLMAEQVAAKEDRVDTRKIGDFVRLHVDRPRPSADHTILSPSGRCSKRAREAALKREAERLFPPGYWDEPEPTPTEKALAKAKSLRQTASNLYDLAARGMQPRKFRKEADKMMEQAVALEKEAKS